MIDASKKAATGSLATMVFVKFAMNHSILNVSEERQLLSYTSRDKTGSTCADFVALEDENVWMCPNSTVPVVNRWAEQF